MQLRPPARQPSSRKSKKASRQPRASPSPTQPAGRADHRTTALHNAHQPCPAGPTPNPDPDPTSLHPYPRDFRPLPCDGRLCLAGPANPRLFALTRRVFWPLGSLPCLLSLSHTHTHTLASQQCRSISAVFESEPMSVPALPTQPHRGPRLASRLPRRTQSRSSHTIPSCPFPLPSLLPFPPAHRRRLMRGYALKPVQPGPCLAGGSAETSG